MHRLATDNQLSELNARMAYRGQIFGSLLAGLALIAAIANTFLDGPRQVGVALVGVPILGVAKAFIKSRHE